MGNIFSALEVSGRHEPQANSLNLFWGLADNSGESQTVKYFE